MSAPETHVFVDDGTMPNSRLPLLIYRAALPADAAAIERVFSEHDWPPAWRDGVFPWHHFHPETHEALGVAAGQAKVLFGGPGGREIELAAGDVAVVPAGVGHCGVSASDDLVIVGAYPAGATRRAASRGDPARHCALRAAVAAVAIPIADPVQGAAGALCDIWRG